VRIAEELGVRHPADPATGDPYVMSTDFLFTFNEVGKQVHRARSVKYAQALDDIRTLEKLEIEMFYWIIRDIDWKISTELEIPADLAANASLLRKYRDLRFWPQLCQRDCEPLVEALTCEVLRGELPLSQAASVCDVKFELAKGTSLVMAYHLIFTRRWRINMHAPLRQWEVLTLQEQFVL
jgi:hypothetical protein